MITPTTLTITQLVHCLLTCILLIATLYLTISNFKLRKIIKKYNNDVKTANIPISELYIQHAQLQTDYATLNTTLTSERQTARTAAKEHEALLYQHSQLSQKYKQANNAYQNMEKKYEQLDHAYQLAINEYKQYKDTVLKAQSKSEQYKKQRECEEKSLSELLCKYGSDLLSLKDKPIMNTSESDMFSKILQEVHKETYKNKYGSSICVFPQFSLHSLFIRTDRAENYDKGFASNYILRRYLSKSVDFLVCSSKKNNWKGRTYTPLLAIEIDGPHHDKAEQRLKDEEKNALFKAISLPLLRHTLPKDKNIPEADIQEEIRKILL